MTWEKRLFILPVCVVLAVSCAKPEDNPVCTLIPYMPTVAAASTTDSSQTEGKERTDATSLFVEDNYVYVSVGKTLTILDVTDPNNPTRVSELLLPYNSEGSFMVNDYLFMSDNDWPPGLSIVAVGDPHNPGLMNCDEEITLSLANASLIDNYIFDPFEGDGGLRVYEVTTETEITKLTQVASYQSFVPPELRLFPEPHIIAAQPKLVTDVAAVGTYAYVTENEWGGDGFLNGRIQIFEVSDGKTIRPSAVFKMPDDWGATNLFADDNYLVVAKFLYGMVDGDYSVLILDIKNPTKPQEVNIITDFEVPLTISDGFLYSIVPKEGWATIRVRDMADPEKMVQVDWEVADYGWLYGWQGRMTIVNHHAYFFYAGWLTIVDVTDPFDPHKSSTTSFP